MIENDSTVIDVDAVAVDHTMDLVKTTDPTQSVQPAQKMRLTDAEKKNYLADQKVNNWSNGQVAEKAGVSEGAVRRWKEAFGGTESPGVKQPVKKSRPKVKASPPVAGKSSPSVTQLREELAAATARCAELEAELAVVKPLAKFYFK